MKTKIQRLQEIKSELEVIVRNDYDPEQDHPRADHKLVVALQILSAGTKQKAITTELIAWYERVTKWYA